MPDVITTTSNLSNSLVDQVLARKIWDAAYQASVVAPYVETEILEGRETKTARFSVWLPAHMATFNEDTGMTKTQLDSDKLDVTAQPHGLAFAISGELESIQNKAIPQASYQGGLAAAESVDTDLCLLFPSFSSTIDEGGKLTKAKWLAAIAKLFRFKAPASDRIGILSPKQYQDLLDDASVNIAVVNALSNTVRDGRIGPLYGVEPLQTSLISTAHDDALEVGGMFHRQTMGLAISRTLKVRSLFYPELDQTVIATTLSYGCGAVRPDWGCSIVTASE